MTCREKLAKEHPEYINNWFKGGCAGCPHDYGYLPKPISCVTTNCAKCWDREIPSNIPTIGPGDYVLLKPWKDITQPVGITRDVWDRLCKDYRKIVSLDRCCGRISLIQIIEIEDDGTRHLWYVQPSSVEKYEFRWNVEPLMPKEKKMDISWKEIRELIEDAMEKRDRSVSLYFNPGTGMSVSVYPWPDADELYEQYKKGRITANDYRAKMGLPMVKNAEKFMSKE